MAAVGPRAEWAWIDHLSPGDALRVAWLRGIARDTQAPTDVAQAAALALAEIRRVAEQRMVTVPTPESREVAPGESVKQRWTRSRPHSFAPRRRVAPRARDVAAKTTSKTRGATCAAP